MARVRLAGRGGAVRSRDLTLLPLLILAGGFGTRLHSEVPDWPKPLAPVAGTPFLTALLERWTEQGVRRFTFALHHHADIMRRYVEKEVAGGVLAGCEARCVTEREPLGTGGAVANVVRDGAIRESFLVANADTWLGSGVDEVAAAAPPAIAVVRVANTERYGSVALRGNRISSFLEKEASAGDGWINAGLYHLDPDAFEPWDGRALSLERDLFPGWAASGLLTAVRVTSSFIDIGIPEDYRRYCQWVESGHLGLP